MRTCEGRVGRGDLAGGRLDPQPLVLVLQGRVLLLHLAHLAQTNAIKKGHWKLRMCTNGRPAIRSYHNIYISITKTRVGLKGSGKDLFLEFREGGRPLALLCREVGYHFYHFYPTVLAFSAN